MRRSVVRLLGSRPIPALAVLTGLFFLVVETASANRVPVSELSLKVTRQLAPRLSTELAEKDLVLGAPIFIRVFKLSRTLEVWVEGHDGLYKLFKTYGVCAFSGTLGPKEREGDGQSPEGFYRVTADALNPNSKFHLSFDLGFPNAFDRRHGRSGSHLMIHGSCISEGCFAMTDGRMEEIYTLAHAAFLNGQPDISVHAFPFHMTDGAMAGLTDTRWLGFWLNLKEGYDLFERNRVPPMVWASKRRYAFYPRAPRVGPFHASATLAPPIAGVPEALLSAARR